jgi:hypothetical protein
MENAGDASQKEVQEVKNRKNLQNRPRVPEAASDMSKFTKEENL